MSDNFTMAVRQGDTFSLTLTYTDPAGTAINLTGYTYQWFVSVGLVVNTYTTTPEVTVSSPTSGVISLVLSATETALFDTGKGRFWFRISSSGGVVTTLLEGAVEVEFND